MVQGDPATAPASPQALWGNQAGTLGLWAIVFKRIMINFQTEVFSPEWVRLFL
jgi:hypothetical protein